MGGSHLSGGREMKWASTISEDETLTRAAEESVRICGEVLPAVCCVAECIFPPDAPTGLACVIGSPGSRSSTRTC